uniref:G-type lectin S-receptor-like serine/threonine-protein kinase At4g03230 n=1 Tax=Erigeron canadensis TaxID=72917 RepID=UPI001CB8C36D|nr:G-type lectin S-receptor-like serine/threonine-protein kinase At4g03230 [Erigeron canadensis]
MILSTTNTIIHTFFKCTILFLCFFFPCCLSKDNITTGEIIKDVGTEYLESAGKKFQMGFFSPQNRSEQRYVGIWYAMDRGTIVWVANRNSPVQDLSGFLTIGDDGEVKVLDKDQKVYFDTTSTGGASQKVFKLLDSGNAVLLDNVTGSITWQSFHYPTNTFLPGMKMNTKLTLTSWKSLDDPSDGTFMFQQEKTAQFVIMNTTGGLKPHWKSGSGSIKSFDPKPFFTRAYKLLTNSTTNSTLCPSNSKQKKYIPFNTSCSSNSNNYTRLVMNVTGTLQYYSWVDSSLQWNLDWEAPKDDCSIFGVCGPYGFCTQSKKTCYCMEGFKKINPNDLSAGCKRASDICHNNDEFIDFTMINVENPRLGYFPLSNELECKKKCLESCEYKAYSFTPAESEQVRSGRPANSCWIWDFDLNNLQTNGTLNISIRVCGTNNLCVDVPQGNLDQEKGSPSFITPTHILIFIMAILVIFLTLLLGSLSYMHYKKQDSSEQGRNSGHQMNDSGRWTNEILDVDHLREEDTQSIGIPFIQFQGILDATCNFSDAKKLGEGGFGPVYKGELPGGLEVAVKRLSSLSGQGLEEFRNEVILIAKLQHRNLVRLLGYCMKGNEKILVYEYMPNKSLDLFIFDQGASILLDWAKRYEIIIGIARGLLYLHQDSRLRIIHRDLKTSNILLDKELNPKISDFGLAKIVQGRETEASTNRVIGTYGYMAPEYALEGFFSIKSDVFSFGVVVLEIISGKKNTGSSQFEQNLSLLGYAWNLWKENMPFELMDQRILESCNSREVLKCIIVGLLCVQEDPGDRPTMTNVVLMLASDIASLPDPKQPAFITRKTMSSSSSSSYKPDQTQTRNTLTVTLQEGR